MTSRFSSAPKFVTGSEHRNTAWSVCVRVRATQLVEASQGSFPVHHRTRKEETTPSAAWTLYALYGAAQTRATQTGL